MRSERYRGRHRAPTQTGQIVARSTAAGTAFALPLVGFTTAANAATEEQWDNVAHCESGGNPQAVSGDGMYRGLYQFTMSTWASLEFSASTWSGYGGGRYASRADLASKAEQITIANKVLASQGWGAWPVCSHYAGPATSQSESWAPAQTATSGSTSSATAHRTATYHLSYSKRATRAIHVVRSGDTLSGLAQKYHVRGGWRALYRANRTLIGGNPDLILVGMHLHIPA